MQRIVILAMALFIADSVARAADVEIKAIIASGPKEKPATSFATDTPKLYAMFETTGIGTGDKVRAVLVAEDVGDAAPANTEILQKTLTLDEDTSDGDFSFSKPDKGWPAGKYRVEFYVNNELATKVKFTIAGGKSEKSEAAKAPKSESAEVPNEEELKSMADNSVLAFGRAVKKKNFSGFYEEIASIWQKQTSPEKLREAFKDFFEKEIDVPAAIEGKAPVFNKPPTIDSDGVLVLQGYYPTTPNRVVFQLKYLKDDADWKLVGIKVNLKE